MGTRFLLTVESPVPERVKQQYLSAGPDDTVVSDRIDALPQRVLENEAIVDLEKAGRVARIARSLGSIRDYRAQSSATVADLVRLALTLARRGEGAAALFAANAMMLPRVALVDGDVVHGVMPAGQVVGRIDDVPTCEELVRRIVAEADATLAQLSS
jgi:NAD(P)H-dependent flavin oxidoreductase YrpB (nitropropane dioxygenase family)